MIAQASQQFDLWSLFIKEGAFCVAPIDTQSVAEWLTNAVAAKSPMVDEGWHVRVTQADTTCTFQMLHNPDFWANPDGFRNATGGRPFYNAGEFREHVRSAIGDWLVKIIDELNGGAFLLGEPDPPGIVPWWESLPEVGEWATDLSWRLRQGEQHATKCLGQYHEYKRWPETIEREALEKAARFYSAAEIQKAKRRSGRG